jgi:L-lactate dehydrogenase complex protein LldG
LDHQPGYDPHGENKLHKKAENLIMNSSNQSTFLARVRKALGHPPYVRRDAEPVFSIKSTLDIQAIIDAIKKQSPDRRQQVLNALRKSALENHIDVTIHTDTASASSAIVQLVMSKQPEWGHNKQVVAWDHPLVNQLDLPQALMPHQIPVVRSSLNDALEPSEAKKKIREAVNASFIGITSADYCLADTGTLVLRTRPHHARAVSLVPSIHIAVIDSGQILQDMKELYALLISETALPVHGLTKCLTMITGPGLSRDIEGVPVFGAHGPKEVHLLVIHRQP